MSGMGCKCLGTGEFYCSTCRAHQVGVCCKDFNSEHPYTFKPTATDTPTPAPRGAAYNALMEEETKESLVRMVLDGIDALREAREERDRLENQLEHAKMDYDGSVYNERILQANVESLESTLAVERAAREQEAVEQFNAGWENAKEEAAQIVEQFYPQTTPGHIRRLMTKPVPATSQPPSQPTGGGE